MSTAPDCCAHLDMLVKLAERVDALTRTVQRLAPCTEGDGNYPRRRRVRCLSHQERSPRDDLGIAAPMTASIQPAKVERDARFVRGFQWALTRLEYACKSRRLEDYGRAAEDFQTLGSFDEEPATMPSDAPSSVGGAP